MISNVKSAFGTMAITVRAGEPSNALNHAHFPGIFTYTVFQLAGDVIVAGQADKAGYSDLGKWRGALAGVITSSSLPDIRKLLTFEVVP